jgi:hypothetical protein
MTGAGSVNKAAYERLAAMFAPMIDRAERCGCQLCRQFLSETEADFRRWANLAGVQPVAAAALSSSTEGFEQSATGEERYESCLPSGS